MRPDVHLDHHRHMSVAQGARREFVDARCRDSCR